MINQKITAVHVGFALLLAEMYLILGYKASGLFHYLSLAILGILALLAKREEVELLVKKLLDVKVFCLVFVIFFAGGIAAILCEYLSLRFNNFDTGIYANLISNFLSGRGYHSSILGKPGLANHFTPNLMLLSPLFELYDTFLWLPFLKLVTFFLCPFILFQIGKALLGPRHPYLWLAPIVWMVHRYMNRTLQFEFQASSLALPVILLAFLFAIRRQYFPMLICLIFVLGFKEHMALVWLSVGAYMFFEDKKSRGMIVFFAGIAIGILIYSVVMPSFSASGELSHIGRFAPFKLVGAKFKLVFQGLLSLAFIPVLYPRALFILLPSYALAFVSGDPQMSSYAFHYQDLPLTVLFVCFILGLKEHKGMIHSKALATAFIIIVASNTLYPMRDVRTYFPNQIDFQHVESLKDATKLIPPDHHVLTLDSIGPFFYKHAKLQSILDSETLPGNKPQSVVLLDSADKWPLDEQGYKKLKTNLVKYELQEIGAVKIYSIK